ncbi:MAG: ATP-dependent helicase [Chloroflexota bacterium]
MSRRPSHTTDPIPAADRPATAAPPVDLSVVRELLRGLDREQRRAVTHGEGPLLVTAGPGTGKTEVVTRRIAWLIASGRARPAEILALTFTERAAAEMQARVDLLVPYGRADTAIHTFHAFGDRIVRAHAHLLGLPEDPRVLGPGEVRAVLRDELFSLGLRRLMPLGDPARELDALADAIARAKDAGLTAADLEDAAGAADARAESLEQAMGADAQDADDAAVLREEAAVAREVAGAWRRYADALRERGCMDFSDQVVLAERLLAGHPTVADATVRRFRYVLVDEGQDTDVVQARLLERIAPHGNVTIVGDADQAIYAFRGAGSGASALRAPGGRPARHVILRRNHRSRAPILAAAHRTILHQGTERTVARDGDDRPLVAVRRGRRPAPVRVHAFRTAAEEADAVVAEIAAGIAAGRGARDYAILVRTHADARPFRRALDVAGIAWTGSDGSGLARSPEARALAVLLRAVADPEDDAALYGVLTADPWRVDDGRLSTHVARARATHRPLLEVLTAVASGDEPADAPLRTAGLGAALDLLASLVRRSHRRPAEEIVHGWLRESGRLAEMAARAAAGDDAPVLRTARLLEVIRGHGEIATDSRLAFLLPVFDGLIADLPDPAAEADGPAPDAVSVLTVHRAKGLEFPVVFLTGCVDGRFPSRDRGERIPLPRSLRTDALDRAAATLQEERRLFYVALTRARDVLVLTWSELAGSEGGRRRRPSPFLAEAVDLPPVGPTGARADAALAAIAAGAAEAPPETPVRLGVTGAPLGVTDVDEVLACPLRYHLGRRVGLPEPAHHARSVGRALHAALAAWKVATLTGDADPATTARAVLDRTWRNEGFLSRAHEEARFAAAHAALERAVTAEAGMADRETVAVEQPFAVEIAGVALRGRYDRIDRTDGGEIVVDYKSGAVRDARHATERARASTQLHLYALARAAETGRMPVAVELRFLESGDVARIAPDPARLARASDRLARAAATIAADDRRPTPDRFACGQCPWRRICPTSAA